MLVLYLSACQPVCAVGYELALYYVTGCLYFWIRKLQ